MATYHYKNYSTSVVLDTVICIFEKFDYRTNRCSTDLAFKYNIQTIYTTNISNIIFEILENITSIAESILYIVFELDALMASYSICLINLVLLINR